MRGDRKLEGEETCVRGDRKLEGEETYEGYTSIYVRDSAAKRQKSKVILLFCCIFRLYCCTSAVSPNFC